MLAPYTASWPWLHFGVASTIPILERSCQVLPYTRSPWLPGVLQLVVVGKEEGVSLFWTFFLLLYRFHSETSGSGVSIGPEARRGFALGPGV